MANKLYQFHKNLLIAFGKANKIILDRLHGEIRDNELVVTIRREKQGLCNCINASIITVHPVKTHQMMIEEVMVGYDSEGSSWSDHMGGTIVDCSGLNVQGAIEKIVAGMNEFV
jgi:hypothetical protein